MTPLQQLDLNGLHVLDGGMATELERKGFNLAGPLWSAHVLESSPEAIASVHREYLEAGADCLLTASYQVSAEGFQEIGFDAQGAAKAAANALRASVALAERVRSEYQAGSSRRIWIAASLGPYGAMLHNGAEYHGNYDCSFEELVGFHSRRIAVVAPTNADFLAFESIPSLEEAQAILAALQPYPDLAAYLSFTCQDGMHVSHGETLRACAELLDDAAPGDRDRRQLHRSRADRQPHRRTGKGHEQGHHRLPQFRRAVGCVASLLARGWALTSLWRTGRALAERRCAMDWRLLPHSPGTRAGRGPSLARLISFCRTAPFL